MHPAYALRMRAADAKRICAPLEHGRTENYGLTEKRMQTVKNLTVRNAARAIRDACGKPQPPTSVPHHRHIPAACECSWRWGDNGCGSGDGHWKLIAVHPACPLHNRPPPCLVCAGTGRFRAGGKPRDCLVCYGTGLRTEPTGRTP